VLFPFLTGSKVGEEIGTSSIDDFERVEGEINAGRTTGGVMTPLLPSFSVVEPFKFEGVRRESKE
jgi:hypothetical protein